MMFARKRTEYARAADDEALEQAQAEAEREHIIAHQQERAADAAVKALTRTRLRNGFGPAIQAGIINNRKGT